MSVKNPQLAGFLLSQNRSNFLYVEGSSAWLYDCSHHLFPLNTAEQFIYEIPSPVLTLFCMLTQLHVKHLIMQMEFHLKITHKMLMLFTAILFNFLSQLHTTPQPIENGLLLLFEPTQIQTAISPNTFTARPKIHVILLKHSNTFILKKNSHTFGIIFLNKTLRKHSTTFR